MTTPEGLLLWGVGTSRTLRPHWAMHELGLAYTCRPILPRTGETQTAEYTHLNPRQKVPLLQDGAFTIGESAAIAAYLSRRYGTRDKTLIPEKAEDYARWLEWCFFICTELDSTSLYVMRRHRDLKALYGDAPNVVKSAGEYFTKQVRHVEQALSDDRQFLVGDRFTTADLLLATCLVWAIDYGVGIPAALEPYLARIVERPAYQAGLRANAPPATVTV
ncbi:glutathione S-transferase family protein [Caenimonas sp. S4]|nr:glutathione S-transferase family protein [Caenimonas soli]